MLRTSRRRFLRHVSWLTAAAAARGSMPTTMTAPPQPAVPLLDTNALRRYIDPLPVPSVAKAVGTRPSPTSLRVEVPFYRISASQFQSQVHRDVPPTTLWGYAGSCPGPTIEARRDQPILVEWVNDLPQEHLFAVDHTLHGAEVGKPQVRTVVHLHGGRTGPESDGYPESWVPPGQAAVSYYPNGQEAAGLFYHDHAMGITRLNTVAGLVGMYLVRDAFEDSLALPRGQYEIPLILFDRSFRRDGQIYYPVSTQAGAPWVSEYYGSAILVNGRIFPYLEVEPRKYRFRVLNSSNGSFYRLSLAPEPSVTAEGLDFYQIGSDQGFLEAPAKMNTLILGPGERADLIVDFSGSGGRELFLRTHVAVFLQFRVGAQKPADDFVMPLALRPVVRMSEGDAVKTRSLTLADFQNRLGRSSVMLLNGAHWDMPVTEDPVLHTTEIWSFINLTDDSHPIHLHMVRFQMLDRTPFDLANYELTGKIVYTGPPIPLTLSERGWKDTVRVDPVTVTRIVLRFEDFTGRYVWHCHMLEHEDNEMMRPYVILPAIGAGHWQRS